MKETAGSRIKHVRVHFRQSQDEFSRKLGVSQFTLSNYETDKRFPDARFLLKLKEMTSVDLNWLVWGEKESGSFSPDLPETKEMGDFFYWFGKLPLVSHSALAILEGLKFQYPEMFKETKDKEE